MKTRNQSILTPGPGEIGIYNAAVFKFNQTIFLIPRVLRKDHVSEFTLAFSQDGQNFSRFSYPIMFPDTKYEIPSKATLKNSRERGGIEDPRAIIIENRIYLTYTAYQDKCHIALASIGVETFQRLFKESRQSEKNLSRSWNKAFKRHGLVFPEEKDSSRNACLTQLDKNLVALIYRTGYNNTYISLARKPTGPFRDLSQEFLAKNFDWEQDRIGISSPAIKLGNQYFYLYHGAEKKEQYGCHKFYHLGGLLVDFQKKGDILDIVSYKFRKPLISPGKRDVIKNGWLWPVKVAAVFSCGAVKIASDKILVVYSVADHHLCAEIIRPLDLLKEQKLLRKKMSVDLQKFL
jgi:predicted GH43/DUF377 family glycosyl hydrolase